MLYLPSELLYTGMKNSPGSIIVVDVEALYFGNVEWKMFCKQHSLENLTSSHSFPTTISSVSPASEIMCPVICSVKQYYLYIYQLKDGS